MFDRKIINKARKVHENLLLGEQIMNFRKSEGFSVRFFSQILGVSVDWISGIESDKKVQSKSLDKSIRALISNRSNKNCSLDTCVTMQKIQKSVEYNKTVFAILMFLECCGDLSPLFLNKMLFFLNKELKKRNSSLEPITFVKAVYGAEPHCYNYIYLDMENKRFIKHASENSIDYIPLVSYEYFSYNNEVPEKDKIIECIDILVKEWHSYSDYRTARKQMLLQKAYEDEEFIKSAYGDII